MRSEIIKELAGGNSSPRARFKVADLLNTNKGKTIAFVGAGGKSTAMFQLPRELHQPILITTTTHLGAWQIPLANSRIVAREASDLADLEFRGTTLITGFIQDDRVASVSEDMLYWLHAYSQRHNVTLLIEADGSRQKALKSPNENEPAIPDFVDVVIVVAGLSGLRKSLMMKMSIARTFSRL